MIYYECNPTSLYELQSSVARTEPWTRDGRSLCEACMGSVGGELDSVGGTGLMRSTCILKRNNTSRPCVSGISAYGRLSLQGLAGVCPACDTAQSPRSHWFGLDEEEEEEEKRRIP